AARLKRASRIPETHFPTLAIRTGKMLQIPGNYYAQTAHSQGGGSPVHCGYGSASSCGTYIASLHTGSRKPASYVECTGATAMPDKWSGNDERQCEVATLESPSKGRSNI